MIEFKGGCRGLGHRTIGISKNGWLNKFQKIAYIKWFFSVFRHFMHSYEMKSSNFIKLGDFFTKISKFLWIFDACGAKNGSINQIFTKNVQKFRIFGVFGAEKWVTERLKSLGSHQDHFYFGLNRPIQEGVHENPSRPFRAYKRCEWYRFKSMRRLIYRILFGRGLDWMVFVPSARYSAKGTISKL